jgi:hypothetical protein
MELIHVSKASGIVLNASPRKQKGRQIVSFGLFWQRQNRFDARCAESAGQSGKCSR